MKIANGFSFAIAGNFLIWAAAGLAFNHLSIVQIGLALVCGVAAFALGALAFAAGVMGGGDVKLLAVTSLFAGPALEFDLLTVTALVGGLLGLAMLAGAPIGPGLPAGSNALQARLRNSLPYGPAIAAGGLWVAASLALA